MGIQGLAIKLRDKLVARRDEEADPMVSLEQSSRTEIIARHCFLLILSVAGAMHFDIQFPLYWVAFYICTTFVSWFWQARLKNTRSLFAYVAVLTIFLIRILTFRLMLVYLWFFPHPAGVYFSFFMLVAAVRFSVNLKSRIRSYMYLHSFADLLVLLIITYDFFFLSDMASGAYLLGLTTLFLIVYYIITFWQNRSYLKEMELLEAQKRQAQKMEAVGRLTGGVAHDFNNILTVVMGNLELHDVMDDPKEKRVLLQQTRDAARRAADLTSQLLAFSRKSRLTQDVHDISVILDQVKTLSDRLLPANIEFQHRVAPWTSNIRADATQLEVALMNLIINARDAMVDGGTIVVVAQDKQVHDAPGPANPGPYVCIDLTDEGGGIPADILDKVVEPFFTTKPVGKGSGLGLSMVKGFAEQSGGFLKISTVHKRSTTMSIYLPAFADSADSPVEEATP